LHDLAQHAGGRRGHFEHHLVGLDLDQDLIHGHGITGLLLPRQQGGFGHGFGQLRNLDFYDRHDNLLVNKCIGANAGPAPGAAGVGLYLVSTKPLSLPKACPAAPFAAPGAGANSPPPVTHWRAAGITQLLPLEHVFVHV
jgi:hypothetical protein